MKRGLVLEGGAMRGMYTAGVLDVFFENGVVFDGIIGVSAGAIFGVNYLSGQPGRVIRYSKRFNSNKKYMGFGNLIRTGNIVGTEFAYSTVPRELDVFDDETFMKSESDFYAVVTNVETGAPEYIRIDSVFEQMDVLRASASMPFLSKPVRIGKSIYLDGAVTDSIPYRKFLEMGYDKLVVVLTKPADYVKEPISPMLSRMFYRKKYPLFEERVHNRHIMYNETIADLLDREKAGEIFALRPSVRYDISRIEKDAGKLQGMYDIGVKDAKAGIGMVKEYLRIN